jgi:ATP-dependent Clp protease ATP-binding subunit ClpC
MEYPRAVRQVSPDHLTGNPGENSMVTMTATSHMTAETQSILILAKEFARQCGQQYIGTEHLLLAILGEPAGLGARALESLSVDQDRLMAELDLLLKARLHETWVMGRLPGTPHFRDILARARDRAKGTQNWQVGSEHLVLAILEETNCTGCRALKALGVTLESARAAITGLRQDRG